MAEKYQQKNRLNVKQVVRTSLTCKQFRQIARDSCGEMFEPPEGDKVFFAHTYSNQTSSVLGVASYKSALKSVVEDTGEDFGCALYHHITYIFIRSHEKGKGHGSKLLNDLLRAMTKQLRRPVRVLSAEKAVPFFEKNGFVKVGNVLDTACGGSPLFSRLYPMQRNV